jgi:hypothetical protein
MAKIIVTKNGIVKQIIRKAEAEKIIAAGNSALRRSGLPVECGHTRRVGLVDLNRIPNPNGGAIKEVFALVGPGQLVAYAAQRAGIKG